MEARNITSDAAVVRCNSHGLLLVVAARFEPMLLVVQQARRRVY